MTANENPACSARCAKLTRSIAGCSSLQSEYPSSNMENLLVLCRWNPGTTPNHLQFTCYDLHDMRKIAVVDDNADNRLIIRTILEDQYDILEFSTGIEAIEGFRKNKPDVVILDISLPEMDGTEILRRIREDSALHDLPVVALTAHAMVGDREKYLAAGFNDYIAKPILDMNVL